MHDKKNFDRPSQQLCVSIIKRYYNYKLEISSCYKICTLLADFVLYSGVMDQTNNCVHVEPL